MVRRGPVSSGIKCRDPERVRRVLVQRTNARASTGSKLRVIQPSAGNLDVIALRTRNGIPAHRDGAGSAFRDFESRGSGGKGAGGRVADRRSCVDRRVTLWGIPLECYGGIPYCELVGSHVVAEQSGA